MRFQVLGFGVWNQEGGRVPDRRGEVRLPLLRGKPPPCPPRPPPLLLPIDQARKGRQGKSFRGKREGEGVEAELSEVLLDVLVLAGGREPGVGYGVRGVGFRV